MSKVPLSEALARAIANVRAEAGDRFARIAVLTPSPTSATLAQRSLGRAGPFVQVRFLDPERLLAELGEPPLIRAGRRPEPAGWLESTVLAAARRRAESPGLEPHAAALSDPRWAPLLARAVVELEGAGLEACHLDALPGFDDPRRAALLAGLLAEVAEARARDGLYGPADVFRAVSGLEPAAAPLTAARDQGYVILGDRALSPLGHDALARWLGTRPGVRVELGPNARAEPARSGLRAAALEAGLPALEIQDRRLAAERAEPSVSRIETSDQEGPAGGHGGPAGGQVGPAGGGALVALSDRLGRSEQVAPLSAPRDGSVRVLQTLDERREAREVVRAVIDAVREGVPLDRIAVALPNAAEVDLLWGELDRAGIPFVSLLGPPLARAPAARLLLTLLRLQDGLLSLSTLHRLSVHPELGLRALDREARRGQARWPRLLRGLGPLEGLEAIQSALEGAPDAEEEADWEARQGLLRLVRALLDAKRALPPRATWPEHRAAWRRLAETWLRPGRDTEQILDLLVAAPGAEGKKLSLDDARALFESQLEGRAQLAGSLADPSVRIVPPFELFALDAEVVVAAGLAEGVFPERRREDPILGDELVLALERAYGARLEGSAVREPLERRRFFAVVAAPERRLVLTVPRSELMSGRAMAPGRLLLEAARTLGWARSFAELEHALERADTDAAGVARDPQRAVGAREHRLATVRKDPQAGLPIVAASPSGRRLLELHRALDAYRSRVGAPFGPPEPCPHTGRVDPALLRSPLLEGGAVSSGVVDRAVRSPSLHFFRDLLGAWAPRALHVVPDGLDRDVVLRRVREVLSDLLARGVEDPLGALPEALEVKRGGAPLGPAEAALEQQVVEMVCRRFGGEAVRGIAGANLALLDRPELVLADAAALVAGDHLVELHWSSRTPTRDFRVVDALRPGLRALAHEGIGHLRVVHVASGDARAYPILAVRAAVEAALDAAVDRAKQGWFPLAEKRLPGRTPRPTPFSLFGDTELSCAPAATDGERT